MKTKEEIVNNWLTRYTGLPIEQFGEYILLTNFRSYVELFAERHQVDIIGDNRTMVNATANNITIIDFSMGSPMAATIMDLLTAIKPKAVLFLGKCGGLKKVVHVGDFIIPIAAVRGEGTSNDYLPPEVPALPAFSLQKTTSSTIRDLGKDYWTGTIYSTNRRVWEHDENFKEYLRKIRVLGIDMETATLFSVGFYNRIPTGAVLLISDKPMVAEGIKTEQSDQKVNQEYMLLHLEIGIRSLEKLMEDNITIKHLRFEY
ncbi:MAG: AMP nucleosidase [Bacteroidales bacterium]|nr:AMP nucleosidase [Bacteroidales bacterium]